MWSAGGNSEVHQQKLGVLTDSYKLIDFYKIVTVLFSGSFPSILVYTVDIPFIMFNLARIWRKLVNDD